MRLIIGPRLRGVIFLTIELSGTSGPPKERGETGPRAGRGAVVSPYRRYEDGGDRENQYLQSSLERGSI